MRRLFSYVFGALLVGAVLAPAFRTFTDDSYPLSTYPMFARDRSRVCVTRVLGFDEEGRSRQIPPPLIANREVTQANSAVRAAMRGDEGTRARFCDFVAARVAESSDFAAIRRLEVVRECYRPVAYFLEGPQPLSSRLRAACAVGR